MRRDLREAIAADIGTSDMYGQLKAALARYFPTPPHPDIKAEGRNWWRYMHDHGSAADALLYATLFVPKFVEIEGTVYIDRDDPELEQGIRGAKAAGRVIPEEDFEHGSWNYLEIPYAFGDRKGSDEDDELLANFVAEAWRARLHYRFAPRKFEVRVLPPEETKDCWYVQFAEIK